MQATTSAGCFVLVDHVSFSFEQQGVAHPVLSDVSLQVRAGEIISIVGRSGAGKSTLLRLASGLLTPQTGSVQIDGRSADEARQHKTVGFMPQSPALLPWLSVQKNVEMVQRVNPRSAARFDVEEALRSVGLLEFRHSFPAQLSGGMQHRVALARALAVGGPMLVLDEPFASLDEFTRSALYDLVLQTWAEHRRTMLMVTHNLDEAVLLSDRVVVLSGSPARITEIVEISGARPRRSALDRGEYAAALAALRSALSGEEIR
jgi:NitT/TauT family transport system ATP-binding protein